MKFSTKQVSFGYWHAHYETKSAENHDFEGFPNFGRESPYNDITFSKICQSHPKNEKVRDFSHDLLCNTRKEQPS